jgi:hypothetical protein
MNKLPNEKRNDDRPDALDQILLEEALVPSSGFAASVMEAIEEQAAQPAPIPFPWKLAMPGLAALLAVVVIAIRLVAASLHSTATVNLDPALLQTVGKQAGSIVLALAAAFICLLLTQRLAAGRPVR